MGKGLMVCNKCPSNKSLTITQMMEICNECGVVWEDCPGVDKCPVIALNNKLLNEKV